MSAYFTCAALELPHRFGAIGAQLDELSRQLERLGPVELALLPECALTGYLSPAGEFDLRPFAEPLDGPTSARVAALARQHGIALAAPLIERAGDRVFNTHQVFDREGRRVAHYRKRHPWYPEHWATPGDLPYPLFALNGWNVALAICFDVHFLADEAARELRLADVLLFPSAWCESGADSRDSLLPALARQFALSILHANWGPGEPRIAGQGGSRILGRDGRELARAAVGQRLISARLESRARG